MCVDPRRQLRFFASLLGPLNLEGNSSLLPSSCGSRVPQGTTLRLNFLWIMGQTDFNLTHRSISSSVFPFSHSDSFVVGGPKRAQPTVPGIPGGTRAGAGKIGRMIAEEIMEIHRQVTSSSCSLKPAVLNPGLSVPPPPGTFCNVWGHFRLSQLGGRLLLHVPVQRPGCCFLNSLHSWMCVVVSCHTQDHLPPPAPNKTHAGPKCQQCLKPEVVTVFFTEKACPIPF